MADRKASLCDVDADATTSGRYKCDSEKANEVRLVRVVVSSSAPFGLSGRRAFVLKPSRDCMTAGLIQENVTAVDSAKPMKQCWRVHS